MDSIWLDPRPGIATDPFVHDGHYDAVVAGAGLTGLVTSLLLTRAGLRVAVIESRFVGAGTTGHTTAKLSLLQGTTMQEIRKSFPAEVAHAYVEGNREGQAWLLRYLDEVEVPHQTRDAFTYALDASGREQLEQEAEASGEAGLQIGILEEPDIGLPFEVAGALVLRDQAQFDPVAVLTALCNDVRARGVKVFEDTRLTGAGNSSPLEITTGQGILFADTLIMATGTPVLDRGGYFAKLEPSRSYLAAYTGAPDGRPFPQGMYLSVGNPGRSLRSATRHGKPVLLVGGNGHPVGKGSPRAAARDLDLWAREHFAVAERTHAWSAQDYRSVNAVPFVGPMPRGGGRIHVATGYNKWGMTNAVAAALRLSTEILGGETPWGAVLAHRTSGAAALAETAKFNAGVAKGLVSGWARALTESSPRVAEEAPETVEATVPGRAEGRVVRDGVHPVAESTVDGSTCRVSAICTHLGGILTWNDEERSWDCPLHGSRFAPSGTLIEGPATSDLKPVEDGT